MRKRTFFRIMADTLFVNNPIGKAVTTLVNFCNNSTIYDKKNLKFLGKIPLTENKQIVDYKRKFIFNSSNICGVNSK